MDVDNQQVIYPISFEAIRRANPLGFSHQTYNNIIVVDSVNEDESYTPETQSIFMLLRKSISILCLANDLSENVYHSFISYWHQK